MNNSLSHKGEEPEKSDRIASKRLRRAQGEICLRDAGSDEQGKGKRKRKTDPRRDARYQ